MGITASHKPGQSAVLIKRARGIVEEIHRPITAQEVMIHNPKHWVTKPGVFHALNPVSEVIPPEVVLKPGQTFFLLPFKTMQSLLERQRMCPASLDHLMDRPGLALREWYHRQHDMLLKVCPMKHCKCIYPKERSSMTVVSSALSETSPRTCTMVPHTCTLAKSGPECKPRWSMDSTIKTEKTGLMRMHTSKKGRDMMRKDALPWLSNEGADVAPESSRSFKDDVEKFMCCDTIEPQEEASIKDQQGRGCHSTSMSKPSQGVQKGLEYLTEEGNKSQDAYQQFLRRKDFSQPQCVVHGRRVIKTVGNSSFRRCFLQACGCYAIKMPNIEGEELSMSSKKGLMSTRRIQHGSSTFNIN